jgi:hypothetical protein
MAKGLKGKIRGAGSASWIKGPDGKFNGSTGGGGATAGGSRGIVARSRLRSAIRNARALRNEIREHKKGHAEYRADKSVTPKQRKLGESEARTERGALRARLVRAQRRIATHQKEVSRVEKRGALPARPAGMKLKLKKRDLYNPNFGSNPSVAGKSASFVPRKHLPREFLKQTRENRVLRAKARLEKADEGGVSDRKVQKLRKALINRQRELARTRG